MNNKNSIKIVIKLTKNKFNVLYRNSTKYKHLAYILSK